MRSGLQFMRNHGLPLVLTALFVVMLGGQAIAGLHEYNEEQTEHGAPPVGMRNYLTTGHFIEATAENAVEKVASTPDSSMLAGAELKEAQESLRKAEEAARENEPDADVAHLAYVAEQQAAIAEAKMNEARARQDTEEAEAARNAVDILYGMWRSCGSGGDGLPQGPES